ncbi:MerR family transcriptional regulator [Flavimaricola marinus]|uniref:MerR family regulatory protein n=1 Tax=Flavimaricola marinus TaxID=1819565 RepID=A0A238LJ13_9RHOB|nr:MerR family transcriptional regulator [Flavimaricola marinus]SMY09641.1 MerR family regulatory protein [Flavimaricola marinus]
MAKSRDAFRTISEVSDWLDTPAHVLRFWESKFNQIKPVKRAGGRRYYRPDDMALLSGIKTLLHEQGMTIKGVQKLLRERGIKHVIEIGISPSEATAADDDRTIESTAEAEVPTNGATDTDAPKHVEPAAWDPDDPWPADPAPATPDMFEATSEATAEPEPEPEEPATEDGASEADAPAMPPPRREVSLPFVRARAEASEPPEPAPEAEILSFAKPPRPPIPDMPDESVDRGHPGPLTALMAADRAAIRANASRITPLVARLKVVADRIADRRG